MIERYNQLDDTVKYEYRTLLRGFKDKYNYITQLIRLFDKELLEESIFINYLITLIPNDGAETVDISDKVRMDYYKLIKDNQESIDLVKGQSPDYKQQQGINPAVKPPEERDTLTEILDKINAQFPDVFTEDDIVVLDMVMREVVQHPNARHKSMAKENDFSMFKKSFFPKEFEDLVINLSQTSEGTFSKLFANQDVFNLIMSISAQAAYKRWRSDED